MIELNKIVNEIINRIDVDKSFKNEESDEIKQGIRFDLVQYLTDRLLAALLPEESEKIENKIAERDFDALSEIFGKLSQKKELCELLKQACEEYSNNVVTDLKNLKSMLK